MFHTLPEPGQLVEVRRRRYIVNEVHASTLATSSPMGGAHTATNLVSLSSVEDDDIGEELQILWELEAGAKQRGTTGSLTRKTKAGKTDEPARRGTVMRRKTPT
jgi:hypothetical protein